LHSEIVDFYEYIRPSKQDIHKREQGFRAIKTLFETEIPGSKCFKFGSAATQLFLPKADIDMVILNKGLSSEELFKKAKKVVKNAEERFQNVEFVESARVPLIKFCEPTSGFEFDVCFNEEGGLFAIQEVVTALEHYPEIKYLFLILKIFLRQRKMHNSYTGGIGSFLLFCMLLHFLRDHKARVVRDMGTYAVQNLTLSHLLLQFLLYYGVVFNYADLEIDMTKSPNIQKKKDRNNSFSLVSPQDPTQNLGYACFKFYEIFRIFKNRYNYITNLEHQRGDSMLVHLINPLKGIFDRMESH
jgi:non-canonical poly(A) RNA polymerase PAPD5/7